MNRYRMCPASYRLHYIDRIRPTGTGSALIFGAALDEALNVLLTTPEKSAEVAFETAFSNTTINGVKITIPKSEQILYSKADYDRDLLDENDIALIEEYAEEIRSRDSDIVHSVLMRNYASWLSLRQKGRLMIKAYREHVLPRITVVHAVQQAFELKNESGDMVTGLVDLIADIDGVTTILDNKTAGRPYTHDSAANSEQLALYLHAFEEAYPTRHVGYIVLLKNIKKNKVKICQDCGADGSHTAHTTCNATGVDGERCHGAFDITMTPEASVQIIIDEMPERVEAIVLANADEINTQINAGHFEKNVVHCERWFGSRCPYFDYCHSNCDMKGLVKV